MSQRRPPAPGPVHTSRTLTMARPPAGLSGASGIPSWRAVRRSPAWARSRRGSACQCRQLWHLLDRSPQLDWSTGMSGSPGRPAAGGAPTAPKGACQTTKVWGQGGDDVLIAGGRQVRTALPARTWGRRGRLLPSAGGTTAGTLRCSNGALSTCPQHLLLFLREVFLSPFNTNTWGQAHLPTSVLAHPGTPSAATPRPRLDRCGVTHPADPAPGRHKLVEVDSFEVHD
jgi:hypothetical protein